ncbi:MAG TPA: PAS domain-containing sensor histidine kinase [Gammaproteobacteria bacterium]|nr:PAS domain-containing sensor histidine kinase [Gammaproteobacteria bacterium]
MSGKAYLHALAALVEHAPVGMCVLDRSGTFLVVNEALAAINGVPVEEHIGRTVAEVVPDLYARATEAIHRALDTRTPIVDMLLEAETAQSPGELRCWLESWFPLPADEAGEVRIAIIVREVTTERRMMKELQDADQRKDEFLATLAHELRNPLAPLINCVPLLRAQATPAADKIAAIMERQLETLSRLVDDLNDAGRIRSGKLELQWTDLDLIEVLRDAVATSTPKAEARNHTLTSQLAPEPIGVRGDAVRLKQLFCNLLTNACKFTPRGGRIAVSAARSAGMALVTVSDTGIGIPADKLRSIFARLTQADSPRHMRTQGLGIGLWLAREIAELHGGSIEAFSDGPGRGSRFEVRLPLREGF